MPNFTQTQQCFRNILRSASNDLLLYGVCHESLNKPFFECSPVHPSVIFSLQTQVVTLRNF